MSDTPQKNVPPIEPGPESVPDVSSSISETAQAPAEVIIDDDGDRLASLADLPDNVLAEAMAQLNNPNKPLLAEELVPTTTTTTTQTQAPLPSWQNPEPLAVDEKTKKNAKGIVCPFCLKSCVMLSGAGTHVSQETFLPYPDAKTSKDGCVVTDLFKLTSKMDFENIEVKRAQAGDTFRYLTCGDCSSGPLGITYDKDANRIFYIAHDRIRYIAPKKK